MDKINTELLNVLEDNGRITHEELGKRLNLSRPAIHDRVHKLEKEKFIQGYRCIIDWKKLGQAIKAFIYIRTSGVECKQVSHRFAQLSVPNVVIEECHRLAGEWCFALKARGKTPEDIANLIDIIRQVPGTIETSTTFILSTVKENGICDCKTNDSKED